MFHANTQRMIDYWTVRAAPGLAPTRASIDPGAFPHLVNQAFILGRAGRGRYAMRLAGGLPTSLHGRDLRGCDGLSLWAERDQARLASALEEARRDAGPLVVMAEAMSEGSSLSIEVLFAPLSAPLGGVERYLGLYQPLGPVARLAGRPVQALAVRALHRPAGPTARVHTLRLNLGVRRIA